MDRLRRWLWITGLLVFASGGALGVLLGSRVGPEPEEDAGLRFPEYSSYWLLRSDEVLEELDLGEGQREGIDQLLARHYQRDRELRAELEALANETHSALLESLTPEQRTTLQEVQQRYSMPHLEAETIRELARMRREVGLRPEQQPAAFQAIYDSYKEQRELFKDLRKDRRGRNSREAFRRRLDAIVERRMERLGAHLDSSQLARYREIVEERRRFWERRHHRKRDDHDRRKGRDRDDDDERCEDDGEQDGRPRPDGREQACVGPRPGCEGHEDDDRRDSDDPSRGGGARERFREAERSIRLPAAGA